MGRGIASGGLHGDENFSVVKGDDIGGVRVIHELSVDLSDLLIRNERNLNL